MQAARLNSGVFFVIQNGKSVRKASPAHFTTQVSVPQDLPVHSEAT